MNLIFVYIILVGAWTCDAKSIGLNGVKENLAQSMNTKLADYVSKLLTLLNSSNLAYQEGEVLQVFGECKEVGSRSAYLESLVARISSKRPAPLTIYYDILPNQLPIINQVGIVKMAFRLWSEVTPLLFKPSDAERASEISVKFETGYPKVTIDHSNSSHPIIQINYGCVGNTSQETVAISTAMIHALGHLFGLNHSKNTESTMYPLHTAYNSLYIGVEAEAEVRKVLGHCQADFKFIVDIHIKSDWQTYFFNSGTVWRYSLQHKTSFYGELPISHFFPGMPVNLDHMAYMFNLVNNKTETIAYGFEENKVHHLHGECLNLLETHTFEQFDCPDKLTKVHNSIFIVSKQRLYLFNNTHVWEFERRDFEARKCPRRILPFGEIFIARSFKQQINNAQHIFFSFQQNTVYFISNGEAYKMKEHEWSAQLDQYIFNVEHLGKWYKSFPDVCQSDSL